MGPRARQEQEKQEMRARILEAAKQLILEEGYDNLSMRKIASVIGYSPTAIYLYYKNKAEIVQDLSMSLYEGMVEAVQEYLKEHPQNSVREELAVTYRLFVQSMIRQKQTGDAVRNSPANTMATFYLIQKQKGLERVLELLLQGQDQGIFTGITPDTPWMLQTSLIGFTSYVMSAGLYEEEGWEELLDQYIAMLLKSVSC